MDPLDRLADGIAPVRAILDLISVFRFAVHETDGSARQAGPFELLRYRFALCPVIKHQGGAPKHKERLRPERHNYSVARFSCFFVSLGLHRP